MRAEGPDEPTKVEVRASGCVVWDDDGRGPVVAVVHRPRYDDWSFPKGKREKGESDLECALREVEEETGLTGALGPELSPVRYFDHKGRFKQVRYWLLRRTSGEFVVNEEVDELRWLRPKKAGQILTYSHDLALLDEARQHWADRAS